MIFLNYAEDIEEMSEEARELARNGVVITRLIATGVNRTLYVSTRLPFDECKGWVDWYVSQKFGGTVVSVNIGDFVSRGKLGFTFVGAS